MRAPMRDLTQTLDRRDLCPDVFRVDLGCLLVLGGVFRVTYRPHSDAGFSE